ncbi:MAG: Acyl-CoA:1-acyl-sn-glycerol-3-phosphate acyltransferase [uncultured Nocardioidaceae bacterium]|uniref:Acyl-CoA:1-acyl-sn-glycerol-3-phosphate acyltransferase n=1 Tax=uncultured Nocardioidaceae bacterium TaxID=253824 RepID=A0A6J4MR50_9ACTN|nr:MAG: Acyl-CoA:1-acyl-sn-glycerol-3-phosphate acyltransferase [uncultured Nocardioidaceae bacterium]
MRQRRRVRERRTAAHWVAVVVLKPLLLTFTEPRWSGGEHVPEDGGVVLAANHISHADPFTFALFVYDQGRLPRFLAKSEVFAIPVARRILTATGQIPVHRWTADASHAFAAAVAAVRAGEAVVVYPEGTLTRRSGLWPMAGKTGAARIALASGAPVVPVAQWGVHEVLYPYARRPSLRLRTPVHTRAGAPVDLDDLRGRPLTPELTREATERIMTAITTLLEELRAEHAPADTAAIGTTRQPVRTGS